MLKILKFDCYDGLSLCEGLIFYAPVALLVRTQAGLSVSQFFLLQGLLSAVTFLGEIPAGLLTDRIGYKRTLVLAQGVMLLARLAMLAGFLLKSPWLFALEALLEGIGFCFFSGTDSAYLYEVFGEEGYIAKTAQAANYGTGGFLLSTLGYGVIYRFSGIPGLLLATVCTCAGGLLFAAGLPREPGHARVSPAGPKLGQMVRLLWKGREFAALGAVLSLSWLLVNFFYAPKLLDCRLDAGWMTPVILGYSLVQMLGKGILAALAKRPRAKVAGMFCAIAAAAMAALGLTRRPFPAVSLMLLLPLLLTVPGYCLSALENTFISRLGQDENRAAALSMLSMGTHLTEILALFASAALTATGPELCFPAVGILLLTCGIGFALKN